MTLIPLKKKEEFQLNVLLRLLLSLQTVEKILKVFHIRREYLVGIFSGLGSTLITSERFVVPGCTVPSQGVQLSGVSKTYVSRFFLRQRILVPRALSTPSEVYHTAFSLIPGERQMREVGVSTREKKESRMPQLPGLSELRILLIHKFNSYLSQSKHKPSIFHVL